MWNSGLLSNIANRAAELVARLKGPEQIRSRSQISDDGQIRHFRWLQAEETTQGSGLYNLFDAHMDIVKPGVFLRFAAPLDTVLHPVIVNDGQPLTREEALRHIAARDTSLGFPAPAAN